MKKQSKPNLQLLLKSTISALQLAYRNYQKAVIEDLQFSWYSDKGELTFLFGVEERKKNIVDLGQEVVRLQAEVDEIKNKIKAKEKSEVSE